RVQSLCSQHLSGQLLMEAEPSLRIKLAHLRLEIQAQPTKVGQKRLKLQFAQFRLSDYWKGMRKSAVPRRPHGLIQHGNTTRLTEHMADGRRSAPRRAGNQHELPFLYHHHSATFPSAANLRLLRAVQMQSTR